MRETEGWKSFAKTSGVTRCSLKLLYFITLSGERERKEGGREGRKHLRRKRQSTRVKEVFVHSLTLLESVSSPGSSHKADVESLLAAAQTERVQRLLCMPGRDLLPQISTRSQKRDRCSWKPVDTEQGVRLLITATWVMKPLFYVQMIKLIPGC